MTQGRRNGNTTNGHGTNEARAPSDGSRRTSREAVRERLRDAGRHYRPGIEEELAQARRLREEADRHAARAMRRRELARRARRHGERVGDISDELGLDPDREATPKPSLADHESEVELETYEDGLSHTRIVYDRRSKRYRYAIVEPPLLPIEEDALAFLKDTLYRTLDRRTGVPDRETWRPMLLETIEEAIVDHDVLLDGVGKQRVHYYLLRDLLGYGPLQVLMHDPMIEDISGDGPGIPVYVYHRQYGSIRTDLVFDSGEALDGFVVRLAQLAGKHISLAEPLLDATLPDTSRLQATLSHEVTTRGSSFTVRKFRADPLTMPDLVRLGTFSPELGAFLWLMIELERSILFAGGTASGKTTSLNAVCQFIPTEKKIVSIEDTREINLRHENWIASVTRPGYRDAGGAANAGAIDMYRLLEAALRQRPEYLLVGEVRGAEAKTLFQAMATGHATYSTLHADSVKSAVYRLENQPIGVPRIMLGTLHLLGIQVQTRIGERLVRRVKELAEIVGIDPDTGELVTNTVFRWDAASDQHRFLGAPETFARIAELRNVTQDALRRELDRRAGLLDRMASDGVRRLDDVADMIGEYRRDPRSVLERAGIPCDDAPEEEVLAWV